MTCQSHYDYFRASIISFGPVPLFFISATKIVVKGQRFAGINEIVQLDEENERGIEKWIPEMFPIILQTFSSVSLTKRTNLKEYCATRPKVTDLCVIN